MQIHICKPRDVTDEDVRAAEENILRYQLPKSASAKAAEALANLKWRIHKKHFYARAESARRQFKRQHLTKKQLG